MKKMKKKVGKLMKAGIRKMVKKAAKKAVKKVVRKRVVKRAAKNKVEKVMHEFKEGALHSGSKKGPKVSNPKQAIAIALSEARRVRKKKK